MHPDPDTLASFRRRFLDDLAGLFEQVLEMAREMKLLKAGHDPSGWNQDQGECLAPQRFVARTHRAA
jgi:hypothetical protein